MNTSDKLTIWCPPDSYLGIGMIALNIIPEHLSYSHYQGALATRIDRIVGFEDEVRARSLLSVVDDIERLSAPSKNLHGVGLLLVENSEWLLQRCGMPFEGVPASMIQHNEDLVDAYEEDNLEEFLNLLYSCK